MFDIEVDRSIAERWEGRAVLGVCRFEGCSEIGLREADELETAISAMTEEVQGKGRALLEELHVQQMRETFRAMPNMDPSRYRPASESLIRRVIDTAFFRISPLVDTNNLLSVKLQLPLGIYDLARVPLQGWVYRLGYTGEVYRTLSQQEKSAEGKLVLADAEGIFGSPVSDSGRATIQPGSRDIAIVAYLPRGMMPEESEGVVKGIQSVFQTWFAPKQAGWQVVEL